MEINLKLCDISAKIPSYMTDGASGFDFFSVESAEILPQHSVSVSIGIAFEIPKGYEIQMRPRSGLAFNHDILALFGTIDSDYRGTVKAKLWNLGSKPFLIEAGQRIAQGVLQKVERAEFVLIEQLTTTGRGEQGYGHTGI